MRIALEIEYEGTRYHGFQRQAELDCIQTRLECALSQVAAHPVTIICAGRTDAGVHASGQVVHFDTNTQRELKAWVLGTNSYLPADIRVRVAKPVSDDFHARFSALSRRYHYLIDNRPVRPAIGRQYRSWCYEPLDENRMQAAAHYFLGEKDFSAFRCAQCQSATPYRNVHTLTITRDGDFILIDIKANAFLHHMVRNIAGVLMEIGKGKQAPEWADYLLQARDRSLAPATAAPTGLSLVAVEYPEDLLIGS